MGILHEISQKLKLSIRQFERTALAKGLSPEKVDFDPFDAEGLLLLERTPSQQRSEPREQFVERKRLDQIVIGAGVEPLDPVVDGIARRENQDGLPDSLSAKLA